MRGRKGETEGGGGVKYQGTSEVLAAFNCKYTLGIPALM